MSRLIPRKRWKRLLLAMILLLGIGWLVVPQLFVPAIRAKLESMLASQLTAKVHIGRVSYWPPYGLQARDVRVVANDPKHGSVEVLRLPVLDLKLARLPFREGPLIIQNISLHRPEVHVVLADGVPVGRGHVVRDEGDPVSEPSEKPKLSEMFLLRHFGLKGGSVIIENRDRPGSPPMVWKALDIEMQTIPKSGSEYDFSLNSDDKGVADVSAEGSFDLDALWVNLTGLHVQLSADPAEQEALPPEVQSLLKHHEIAGRVTLDATGKLFLRDRPASAFSGSLVVTDASAALPERAAAVERVNASLRFSRRARGAEGSTAAEEPLRVWIERFVMESGKDRLSVGSCRLQLDRANDRWLAEEINARLDFDHPQAAQPRPGRRSLLGIEGTGGYLELVVAGSGKLQKELLAGIDWPGLLIRVRAHDARIHARRFFEPFDKINGEAEKAANSRVVGFRDVSLLYGHDQINVRRARLSLPADPRMLRDAFRLQEITGVIDFGRPATRYPGKFGKVVAKLSPAGPFHVGGGSWYARRMVDPNSDPVPDEVDPDRENPESADHKRKKITDYFFSISSDRGQFHLLDGRLPLTAIRGDGKVTAMSVDIQHIHGDLLGGSMTGEFHYVPRPPRVYTGEISLREVDLHKLGEAFDLPAEQREPLTGRAFANMKFAGLAPANGRSLDDTLRASGEFEIFGGHLWTLPVFRHIAEQTRQPTPLTMSEAAGRFSVADRLINLTNVAVSSPALGLQGSGTVGLDKTLDLRVMAVPLGDWRERVKRGNIPVVSDVTAEVLGAVQQILNTATSALLFEFRISGSTSNPKLETIPAPIVTDSAALLFGNMLRDPKDRRWADTAKKEPTYADVEPARK